MNSWADLDFDPFGDRFRFALAKLDLDLTALLQITDSAFLILLFLQAPVQPDQRMVIYRDRLSARRAGDGHQPDRLPRRLETVGTLVRSMNCTRRSVVETPTTTQ